MKQKIRGIVIQTIKHNDRHNIVTLYTGTHGRLTCLTSASTGKTSRMRRAMLSPLSVIESDINVNKLRELQFLGSVSVVYPWRNLYFDPDKIAMTFFVADFLSALLRKSPEDDTLFRFLLNAIHALDETLHSVSNFHICFLFKLALFMGIEPDYASFRPGARFDMREGIFLNDVSSAVQQHSDMLSVQYTSILPLLSRMTFSNYHLFRFSGEQRRIILNHLMRYYSIHLSIPTKLKSLDILHDLYI